MKQDSPLARWGIPVILFLLTCVLYWPGIHWGLPAATRPKNSRRGARMRLPPWGRSSR